ncbi:hypothetical protein LSUB1_G001164 [Lachnellula subtilissima]|uniref:Uncharacterized protein n=1 Tax=Lachnellula subtilissima TaxID=602034 RepID=A0A8H8RZM1_9HELO|nr:hypothetical protein LSUB1_G001164 [Lachnellula subtilissima]
MSTDAQPPTPPPHTNHVQHHLPRRLSLRSLSHSLSRASLNTDSPQPAHRRSTSLQNLVSRILPTRREEKGHTLRPDLQNEDTNHSQDLAADFIPGLKLTHPSEKIKHDHSTLTTKVGVSSRSSRNKWGHSSRGDSAETVQSNGHGRLSKIFGSQIKVIEQEKPKMAPRAGKMVMNSQAYSLKSSSQDPAEAGSHAIIVVEPKESKPTVEKEVSKSQRMFEEKKKARREQRRALQESGDFLGVQGANPRTGYWDSSDATSSTELSQTTDDMKNKLEVRATENVDKKEQFAKSKAAEAQHYTEIERAESDRDLRKKQKAERKELEYNLNQRRVPRWKATENEWSSIAEPELSPIEQLHLKVRFSRYSLEKNATHYVPQTPTKPRDYFVGLPTSFSPFVCERSSSKPAESAYRMSPETTIPRKPVGSYDSRQQGNKSDDTVLHLNIKKHKPAEQTSSQKENPFKVLPDITKYPEANNKLHDTYHIKKPHPSETSKMVTALAGETGCLDKQTSGRELDSFLDHLESESGPRVENKTTVTSYQSVSTKQVETRQPLVQNQQASIQEARILPLNLPPVYFKDPVAARIPQNSHPLSHPHPAVWAPPTILDTEPDIFLSSNTSTTTTIGCFQNHPIPCQFHGEGETMKDLTRPSPLRRKQSNIPLRTMYHLGTNVQSNTLGNGSPTTPVDTVISSEHKLDQTKQRTLKLCHLTSLEGERVEMKNTPTSIYTSPLSPTKQRAPGARNAARERTAAARETPLATPRSASVQEQIAAMARNAARATPLATPLATRGCLCKRNQDEAVTLYASREQNAAQALPPATPRSASQKKRNAIVAREAARARNAAQAVPPATPRSASQNSLDATVAQEAAQVQNAAPDTPTATPRSRSIQKRNAIVARNAARERNAARASANGGPQKQTPSVVRTAARTTTEYQNMRHELAVKKSQTTMEEGEMSCPRLRPKAENSRHIIKDLEAVLRGIGDTGSPSNSNKDDRLVVWHPTPSEDKAGRKQADAKEMRDVNKELEAILQGIGDTGSISNNEDDQLVVWHPTRSKEKAGRKQADAEEIQRQGLALIWKILVLLFHAAWWFGTWISGN